MQKSRPEISSLTELTLKSDGELITLTREGQSSAFAVLWQRHYETGMKSAHFYAADLAPQDLVAEAYARIFSALNSGKGPDSAFSTYLQTTIKNLSVNWRKHSQRLVALESSDAEELAEEEPFDFENQEDRRQIAEAFRTLPDPWQEVLWLREVLDLGTKEVASRLGITPNAAAALTFRAKEGLRQAWIGRQIKTRDLPDECKLNVDRLPGYLRKTLGARDISKTEKHLAVCENCPEILANMREVASKLHLILVPATLAGAGGLLFGSSGDPASAATANATAREPGFQAKALSIFNPKVLVLIGVGIVIAGAFVIPSLSPAADGPKVESQLSRGGGNDGPTQTESSDATGQFIDDLTLSGRSNDAVRSALYSLPTVPPDGAAEFSIEPGTTLASSDVILSGFAAPEANVRLTVSGDQIEVREQSVRVLSNGAWYATVASLPVGSYSASAVQQVPGAGESNAVETTFLVAPPEVVAAPKVSQIDRRDTRYLPVVRGTAAPGATVIVWINGVRNEGTADSQGQWVVYPDRGGVAGSNEVWVQGADPEFQLLSAPTKPVEFTLVTPELELDRTSASPTIIASAVPKSLIVVTDRDSFVYLAETAEGTTSFTIAPNGGGQQFRDLDVLTAVYTSTEGKRVGAPLVMLQ